MNCIIVDDDLISTNAIKHCISKAAFLNLVATCSNAIDAMEIVSKEMPDLIFLDIEMPEVTGLDFMRSLSNKPKIIFVTSNKDYAHDAFEFEVEDFLLKPITLPRFIKAVTKVKEQWSMEKSKLALHPGDNSIFVKIDSKLIKINTEEILMIEALADYVNIFTAAKTYTAHSTMKGIETKLPPDEFIRIHRSFIVKFNDITEIENNNIKLGKKLLPIGKLYKEDLMKRLNLV